MPKYWSGYPFLSLGDLPNPGTEPRSPSLQVGSLPAEPPGKPSTGVSSLSLLQQFFLTQELNWGLLHCRQILYQLSYQGNPKGRRKLISIYEMYIMKERVNTCMNGKLEERKRSNPTKVKQLINCKSKIWTHFCMSPGFHVFSSLPYSIDWRTEG